MIPASSIYLYGDDALTSLRVDPKKTPAKKTVYTGRPNPNAIKDLGVKLREVPQRQTPPPVSMLRTASIAKPEFIEPTESPTEAPKKPITMKFNKTDGATTSVTIQKDGKERILTINRDEDGNMISATL